MKKPCKRCGISFQPKGKFGKICEYCDKRPRLIKRRQEEAELKRKKKLIGLI